MAKSSICRIISYFSICLCSSGALQSVHANSAFDPQSQWMLGDWNGQRSLLEEQGYRFSLGYTGELASIFDSKRHSSHGTEYADQFAIGAHFDLAKIAGWQGTEAQVTITKRDGQSLSGQSEALDGHLSAAQEIWGRGQTWRLTNLWIKKTFLEDTLDIKVGRFGEGEDFNVFDCKFQNLALCGSQVGNWVGDQWFNWPVSQWAMRVKYNLNPNLYAQIGAYEFNPKNLERSQGFNLSFDGSKGAILPAEIVWSAALIDELPGEYRLGYYYSTADAKDIKQPDQTSHKQGGWVVAKQQLTQHEADPSRGLSAFLNLTVHDSTTNDVKNMQNIGLSYTGLFNQRPRDEIAFGLARIKAQSNAQGARDDEYNAEIYYGLQATNWLTVRPNLQYVHRVGAYKNGDKVWLGGIKLETVF